MGKKRILYAAAFVLAILTGMGLVWLKPQPVRAAGDPVIVAAGDIACPNDSPQYFQGNGTTSECRQKWTSNLIVAANPAAVITLGDDQYEFGALSQFNSVYASTWGRLKAITYPGIGNHEYKTTSASGYFDYFDGVGNATGRAGDRTQGYYSYNVGSWHIVSLNSNCGGTPGDLGPTGCAAGSPQELWLKADLAAHPNFCTLAYWHHPYWSSGGFGNNAVTGAFVQDLYNAHADVILDGHEHLYERFARQNPAGGADTAHGIRQITVGTGGKNHASWGTVKPNSQARNNTTFGVLKMTLHPTSYDWNFVPDTGSGTYTDSGSTSCT